MRIPLLLPVVLAALLVSCTSLKVRTDFDDEIDFLRLEKFAWLSPELRDEPGKGPDLLANPFVHNTLLDKRVRETVEEVLTGRGYRETSDEPDFHLRYEITTREVTRDTGPVYVGGGRYHGRGGVYSGYYGTYTYQEGTLIIDVIDPKTQRIAWRGWASTRISSSNQVDEEKVRRYVTAILAAFPPQKGDPPPEG